MTESYKQRVAIRDICRDYEWDHRPEVLIMVEPGITRFKWNLSMLACGFNNRGEFSKEAHREVIFGQKDLEESVKKVLDEMYYELYESR